MKWSRLVLLSLTCSLFAGHLYAEKKKMEKGTFAVFETSNGNITCRLFEKETPITVANFIGLAEGTKEFVDPKTGEKVKRKFYVSPQTHPPSDCKLLLHKHQLAVQRRMHAIAAG